MKKYLRRYSLLLEVIAMMFFASTSVASAAPGDDISSLMFAVADWANQLFAIFVGLSIVAIFWNLAMFLRTADNMEKKEEYRSYMLWSVVAMTVLAMFWGLVSFVTNTFDLRSPTVKFVNNNKGSESVF